MFEFFLEEYRKSIYKKTRFRKNIPVSEKVWLGITLALVSVALVFCVRRNVIGSLIFALAVVISAGITGWLCERHRSRARDEEREDYLQRTVRPLEDLLQEERCGLYSVRGVDWLIACCEEEINRKKHSPLGIVDSFSRWVFPIITAVIGAIFNELSDVLTLDAYLQILGVVIALWAAGIQAKAIWYQVPKEISWIFGLRKAALPSLLSALEYVRVFVPESAAADTPLPREGKRCPPCCEECVVTTAR